MLDWFGKLFAPEKSGATAKERLRLVLLSDHLALAPDVVENLRNDLIAVISKYVQVDEANCEVSFERQDAAVAMLANIPILGMNDRKPPRGGPGAGERSAVVGGPPPGSLPAAGSAIVVLDEPELEVLEGVRVGIPVEELPAVKAPASAVGERLGAPASPTRRRVPKAAGFVRPAPSA
jgi:cell division topological specificity factor